MLVGIEKNKKLILTTTQQSDIQLLILCGGGLGVQLLIFLMEIDLFIFLGQRSRRCIMDILDHSFLFCMGIFGSFERLSQLIVLGGRFGLQLLNPSYLCFLKSLVFLGNFGLVGYLLFE